MLDLADYTVFILAQRGLSDDAYIVGQLEAIKLLFDNPSWLYMADAEHTDAQVGYLISLMDLERNDRIELLSMMTGLPLKTSNDARITRWMFSVLIDYYLNGEGQKLNESIGYKSADTIRAEKRSERKAAKSAEANRRSSLELCKG
jgi:hypothetical protein